MIKPPTRKPKVLFVCSHLSTFINTDIEILGRHTEVKVIMHRHHKKIHLFLLEFIVVFFKLLVNLRQSNVVYCWFADYHSLIPMFLARLFRKKAFLVLGGYDTTCIRELGYGALCQSFRRFCATQSMKMASMNLPVSDFLKDEIRALAPFSNILVLPTGYNSEKYFPVTDTERKYVLTVALANDYKRLMIKGIDRFLELVRKMVDYRFVIVGTEPALLMKFGELPVNLDVIVQVPHDELIRIYHETKVYVQFSRREGLPNSVIEAMLSGCIPVVTRSGGNPDAVGDFGYILESWDIITAQTYISEAFNSGPDNDNKAIHFAADKFSLQHRETKLVELILQ